jgi:hypothetical protein
VLDMVNFRLTISIYSDSFWVLCVCVWGGGGGGVGTAL